MSEFQVELAESEEGEVVSADEKNAEVKVVPGTVCSSCAIKDNCDIKLKKITIIVDNKIGTRIGDRVILIKNAGGILWGTLILFGGPVAMLIAVYLIADALSAETLISVSLAIASIFAFYLIVKLAGITNWLTHKYSYHIEKILTRVENAN